MSYDLETPERAVKRLAGECPWNGETATHLGSAAYTGWHSALEALAAHLYNRAGWRGRAALLLIRWIARD